LLENLFLACFFTDKRRELASVDAGVQLEQVADGLDALDGDDIGEEELHHAGGGVLGRVGRVGLEEGAVFVGGWVDGKVFGAGREEEVFVGAEGVAGVSAEQC
jgi:hypothetical protein